MENEKYRKDLKNKSANIIDIINKDKPKPKYPTPHAPESKQFKELEKQFAKSEDELFIPNLLKDASAKHTLKNRIKVRAQRGINYTKDGINYAKDYAKTNPYKSAAIATGATVGVGVGAYGLRQLYINRKRKECMRIEDKHERELCLSKYT
jgi:ElaB/YqjD/DUF883 family membrane-anchored ribosome-binding protein